MGTVGSGNHFVEYGELEVLVPGLGLAPGTYRNVSGNQALQVAKDDIPDGLGEPELGPITTGMGQIYKYVLESGTRSAFASRSGFTVPVLPSSRCISWAKP